MNYTESVIDSMINGQTKQAMEQLEKGCKTKPFTMARRAMVVYKELIAMEKSGVASQFQCAVIHKSNES